MPLIIDGGHVPPRWAERKSLRSAESVDRRQRARTASESRSSTTCRTRRWKTPKSNSSNLLDAAAGDIPVFVRLYSLPGVPRGERGQQHLSSFYRRH